MVRLCEIKNELIYYNTNHNNIPHNSPQADFVHLDELLIDLKLSEDALEIPVPSFYSKDFDRRIDERNQLVDKFMKTFHGHTLPEEEIIEDQFVPDLDVEKAIWIIQKNERGR